MSTIVYFKSIYFGAFYHDILDNMQIDAMKANRIISAMQSKNICPGVSKGIFASLWNIPLKAATQTLHFTMQQGICSAIDPLQAHYASYEI